jgi:hypothetical protein
MPKNNIRGGFGRRRPVVAIAAAATLALVGGSLGVAAANAVAVPTSGTPTLSRVSSWTHAPGYDVQGTTLPGTSTPALRISNSVTNPLLYQAMTQLESPAIASAGPRGTSDADYDTFTANFTLSAKSYATQPDLAVEVSVDTAGNRAGGDLLLREEADQKLTLTNFYANAGSAADVGDWNAATTEVSFTKPIAIKYVAHFNPDDSKDTVNVYLNGSKTPALTGSTFETYADSQDTPAETVNALLFRAVDRQVDLTQANGVPWADVAPTSDEETALEGNGFYFSAINYAVTNTAAVTTLPFSVPVITGTPAVGAALTATTDTGSVSGVNFAYQWLRNGVAISKATGSTYTPTSSDYKQKLSVKVTASKPGYSSPSRTSAATTAVGIGTIVVSADASITGVASVGSKLTAHITTAPAATYSFQWFANDVAVKGATASTYTVPAGELGKTISVAVKGTKTDFTTVTSTSDETAAVVEGTLTFSTPTISGTTKVGKSLTAKVTATSGALLRYSFYANDVLVQLSTSPTLVLTWDLAGSNITVSVSGLKQGYTPLTSAVSAPTAAVVN